MRNLSTVLILSVLSVGLAKPALSAGDAEKGKKVFRKCGTCHMVGPNAKNRVGPPLNNLFGRPAGAAEKFRYSKINQNAGEAGLVWTPELVASYLPNPNDFLKKFLEEKGQKDKATGRTKMSFKLTKEGEVADVIAYLQTFSEAKKE